MERTERYLTAFVSAEVGAQNVADDEQQTWRTPPNSSDSGAAASS